MNQNSVSNNKLMEIINIQTEVVQQGMDLSNIMDLVTQRTQLITNANGASVELIEKKELVYSAASGIAEKFLGLRLDMENSLSGECIKARVPLISNDIERDDRVNKEACRQIGLNSMIVMPLIYENDVVGVLKVLSTETGHFNDEDIKILELISGLIAAAMFNAMKNEENELFHMATHDSLTGVSNRALFYDRLRQKLSHALRKHEEFGGGAAIEARFISAPMVIISGLTGITALLTVKFKSFPIILRLLFLFLSFLMGFYGIIFGLIGLVIYFMQMRSYGVPYLLGTTAFDEKNIKDTVTRMPWWQVHFHPRLSVAKNHDSDHRK